MIWESPAFTNEDKPLTTQKVTSSAEELHWTRKGLETMGCPFTATDIWYEIALKSWKVIVYVPSPLSVTWTVSVLPLFDVNLTWTFYLLLFL